MYLDAVIQDITDANDPAKIEAIINDFASEVGMDGAYILNYHPSQGLSSIDQRPNEWRNFYQSNGCAHYDPIVSRMFSGPGNFTWDECVADSRLTKKQKSLLSEARSFGLNQGYNNVINVNEHTMSACCFYNQDAKDFSESIRHNKVRMDVVGIAAQSRLSDLLHKQVDIPVLSGRETECISWAANGKTNDEIGTILNLSSNTINSYIQSACSKLGVRTKIHAVVKAIQLKIIYHYKYTH